MLASLNNGIPPIDRPLLMSRKNVDIATITLPEKFLFIIVSVLLLRLTCLRWRDKWCDKKSFKPKYKGHPTIKHPELPRERTR